MRGEHGRRRRTLCILDVLETLAKSWAVLQFETGVVSSNGVVPFVHAMEGGTLSCITFGPGWVGRNALG